MLLYNACTLRNVVAFGDRMHLEDLFIFMKSNTIFERLTLEIADRFPLGQSEAGILCILLYSLVRRDCCVCLNIKDFFK